MPLRRLASAVAIGLLLHLNAWTVSRACESTSAVATASADHGEHAHHAPAEPTEQSRDLPCCDAMASCAASVELAASASTALDGWRVPLLMTATGAPLDQVARAPDPPPPRAAL